MIGRYLDQWINNLYIPHHSSILVALGMLQLRTVGIIKLVDLLVS